MTLIWTSPASLITMSLRRWCTNSCTVLANLTSPKRGWTASGTRLTRMVMAKLISRSFWNGTWNTSAPPMRMAPWMPSMHHLCQGFRGPAALGSSKSTKSRRRSASNPSYPRSAVAAQRSLFQSSEESEQCFGRYAMMCKQLHHLASPGTDIFGEQWGQMVHMIS